MNLLIYSLLNRIVSNVLTLILMLGNDLFHNSNILPRLTLRS